MHKPSRRMPKFVALKFSLLSWEVRVGYFTFLAFTVFAIIVGLRANDLQTNMAIALLVIFIAVFIVVGGVKQTRARNKMLSEVAAARHDQSICEFAREFDPRTVDTWVIRAVYEQLQHYLEDVVPKFPLHADDLLLDHIVADPDDLDLDLVSEIAQRTGRSLDGAQQNPFYDRVTTVRGLVLFFNAQPKSNNT